MPDALEGLTILDLTSHIAGPYATKVLADLGARVIKIERPAGDSARALPPFLGDEPGPERSALFQFLNTNKESVVLDLMRRADREQLYRLAARADLIVTSSSPATTEHLGIDPDTLQARVASVPRPPAPDSRPREDGGSAPILALTNFGRSGPYRDYRLSDTVLYAMGGEMFSHGLADRPPLKMGGTAALMQCGAMGAIAALGAIHAWEQHGAGQVVDLPLFDVQINSVDRRSSAILAFRFSGRVQERPPAATAGVAGGIYPVADGHVEVTASFGDYWRRFARMIGDPALLDPKWEQPATMRDPAAKEEADAIIFPWMLSRTKREVWEAARREHAMVAPLFTAQDLFDDPVLRERGYWTEIEHELLGRLPMLGRPYILERTPWRIRRPAPRLGQDTERVLAGS